MHDINFSPFPILTTERLTLRSLRNEDDKVIFSLRSNEQVNKYIVRQRQKNTGETREFISKITEGIKNNKSIYWVICLKDNPELIGTICLWNFSEDKTIAELGYELNPSFHGQGIMSEAIRSVIDYAFKTIGMKRIEAFTHRDNESSIRLLVKNNFILDPGREDEGNSNNIVFTLAV